MSIFLKAEDGELMECKPVDSLFIEEVNDMFSELRAESELNFEEDQS